MTSTPTPAPAAAPPGGGPSEPQPSAPQPAGPDVPGGGRTAQQWLGLALGVVVLVVGCVTAGFWQWGRHVERDAAIAIINANYAAEPVPLASLLPDAGVPVPEDDVWRSVEMRGHYVPESTVLLRNRPVSGQASFHVLVPFVTDDGTVMVVNRGWLPYGSRSSEPDSVPAPPAGEVDVVVRLRADEPAATNGAPPGQVQAINTGQVLAAGPDGASWADGLTYGAYGALASETPAPSTAPNPLPVPDTDPRSHLSYAFQWWVFALGAVGGFVVLVRRERRESAVAALGDLPHPFEALRAGSDGVATDGPVPGGPTRSTGRRGPRTRSAEEIEDDLIESGSSR